jgi:hypothetical protein
MANRVELNHALVRLTSLKLTRPLVRRTTSAVNRKARSNAPGGPYSTGHLKSTINWSIRTVGESVIGNSGSDLIYAYSVHEGQPAREITPKRAALLGFYWRRAGRSVKFLRVSHPGTTAQPYMTDALLSVAPRYGFKVTITR